MSSQGYRQGQSIKSFINNLNYSVMKKIISSESQTPNSNSKNAIWKFIIQTAISVLTAILTALGATSCISHM